MAKLQDLPPTLQRVNTGLRVGVYPSSDPLCEIELHRATQGSTGTFSVLSRWSQHAGQGILQFDDRVPDDGLTRYYKAKSVRSGYTDSTFTPPVSGKPTLLTLNQTATPPLSGTPIGVSGWLSTAATWRVGSPGTPASVTKKIRIPHAEFVPESAAESYFFSLGYLRPNTANTVLTCRGAAVLPKGVTVTAVRARMYRTSATNDSAQCAFVRLNDDGTQTSVATVSHAGTGWATAAATGLSQLVGDEGYVLETQLLGKAAVTDARLMWAELEYTMPSYDKGY